MPKNCQIIISGLGGQGVLFITKLFAGAAMAKDLGVKTSETHGMAQRGGNVISYVKIGNFSSPMIRPGQADGMIALKEESFYHHNYFLKPDGICVVNSDKTPESKGVNVYAADALAIAAKQDSAGSLNLVMLGFFLAATDSINGLITMADMAEAVKEKFRNKDQVAAGIINMIEAGASLG